MYKPPLEFIYLKIYFKRSSLSTEKDGMIAPTEVGGLRTEDGKTEVRRQTSEFTRLRLRLRRGREGRRGKLGGYAKVSISEAFCKDHHGQEYVRVLVGMSNPENRLSRKPLAQMKFYTSCQHGQTTLLDHS